MPRTRLDLRKLVADRYGLPSELPEWLDSNWINSRINEGQREVSELTECVAGTCPISGTSNSRLYSLTKEFVRVTKVSWANNSALTKKSVDQLEALQGANWRIDTGAPQYWYEEGARYIGVCPKVRAGSAATLIAYGPRYASEMSNDTATTEITTALHRAVVNYTCREIAAIDPRDSDGSGEARWDARYQNEVGKYKTIRPYAVTFEAPRNR